MKFLKKIGKAIKEFVAVTALKFACMVLIPAGYDFVRGFVECKFPT